MQPQSYLDERYRNLRLLNMALRGTAPRQEAAKEARGKHFIRNNLGLFKELSEIKRTAKKLNIGQKELIEILNAFSDEIREKYPQFCSCTKRYAAEIFGRDKRNKYQETAHPS